MTSTFLKFTLSMGPSGLFGVISIDPFGFVNLAYAPRELLVISLNCDI
jgi:hypothetical protein